MRKKVIFSVMAVMLLISAQATARITEIVITSKDSPTFEGFSFGSVGQYERLVGYARGELNPADPLHMGIVNIDRAPRNVRGNVEYKMDLFILKPIDLKKGNGRIFYDVLNRGRKGAHYLINSVRPGKESSPQRIEDLDNSGFLMRQGYIIVWSGWQNGYQFGGDTSGLLGPVQDRMYSYFPIATQNGSSIVGLSNEEFVDGSDKNPFVGNLNYPAAVSDPAMATLTVREKQTDPRQTPKDMTWRYLNPWQIEITRPAGFDGGAIYEFIYPAKDPIVYGIAFASVRDLLSYFRHGVSDEKSNANPLSIGGVSQVQKVLGFGPSQSGRFLRDFVYQGFNQDENGRQVFDGIMPTIAGSRRTFINYPFAQPGRWSCQHEEHFQPGDQFPFTYGILTDPISGLTDGILARCQKTDTCPKIMHIDTDTEIWQARASLVVTDTSGNDIILPSNVRAYFLTSTQHTPYAVIKGINQNLTNFCDYTPIQRALVVALDQWVTNGTEPPPSRFPKRSDGTLVSPDLSGFPKIPGGNYSGVINGLRLTDYSVWPPKEGKTYPVFVPKVDADGNAVAGIRHPFIEVPTATLTGWNLRARGYAEGELNREWGSYIPFAKTKAERLASGDPRLSLEERYPTREVYVKKVAEAADRLVQERLLLEEDAQRIRDAAALSGIGKSEK